MAEALRLADLLEQDPRSKAHHDEAAAEREACAKVCDGWAKYGSPPAAACAAAIRARTP